MEFECGACYRIFNNKKVHTLKCKHNICKECNDTTSRIICPECGDDFVIVSDTLTTNGSATTSTTLPLVGITEGTKVIPISIDIKSKNRSKEWRNENNELHREGDLPAYIQYFDNGTKDIDTFKVEIKYLLF